MATKRFKNGKHRYTVKNKKLLPKPIYLSFDDEGEGDAYVAELEDLLSRGILPVEFHQDASAIKLHDLIKLYIKSANIKNDDIKLLDIHCDRLANIDAGKITYDWAEQWLRDMKHNRKLAPGTITKHVGSLARCLDWSVRKNFTTTNPLRSLPKGYAQYNAEDVRKAGVYKANIERDRRLEDGEEPRILQVLAGGYTTDLKQRELVLEHPEALQTLFLLALETAMRLREMYTLEVKQVDFPKRTIFLTKTKNGSLRQVPLTKPAMALLKKYIKEQPTQKYLFPWFTGKYDDHVLRNITSSLSQQWRRIFKHAGCTGLTFHDLRHEATSRIFERTKFSDVEISKITGHKTLKMLQRYANLRGSHLAGQMW